MSNECRLLRYLNRNKPINNAHEREKERENEHLSFQKNFLPPIRMKGKEMKFQSSN